MRVSSATLHEATLQHIRDAQSRIARLQTQIASGRRIERPSDDAAGAIRAIEVRAAMRARTQWSRNLTLARQHVNATENALDAVSTIAAEARVIAVQSDGSQTDDALAARAAQINGLLESLLSEANQSQDGVHLFAGSDTRQAPLEAQRDAQGDIAGVVLRSRAPLGELRREVAEGAVVSVNAGPGEVFGADLELFENLISLRDALRAGDRDAAAALQPRLDEDLERIGIAQTVNGVLTQRLDHLEERLEQETLQLEAARSAVEDVDLAQAVIDYQEEQAVLEAALSLSARLLDMTLARYLQ
jgi:flagellar hook-associated protein 3 FlgL